MQLISAPYWTIGPPQRILLQPISLDVDAVHSFVVKVDEADETLLECFARSATAFAQCSALISDSLSFTYGELDLATNRLAWALLALDVSPQGRAAVLMQHDTPMNAAIVAVLKAGKAVIVLNPSFPPERLRLTMADANASILVTDQHNRALAHEVVGAACKIAICEEHLFSGSAERLPRFGKPDDTAFLAYTSGTTGRPKGVMMTHRQIRRSAIAYGDAMHFSSADQISLLGSPSGSQGIHTIWTAFSHGAALCPYPIAESGLTHLPSWIVNRGISVLILSASICRDLIRSLTNDQRFDGVRALRLASETVTHRDVIACRRHFRDDCQFVHSLASSEGGAIAINCFPLSDPIPEGHLATGQVTRGIDVLLLDEGGKPVAQGTEGEIVLRGRYLANGYWRDERLTAERFQAEPGDNDVRRFFSGDIGRYNSNNQLEVIGRKDDRVKIRGNRIELIEVTDALYRITGVAQAVVCTDQIDHPRQLLAFVVLAAGAQVSAGKLRDLLRASLPEHMIPSRITFVDALPLTPHGKIDYAVLRAEVFTARDPSTLLSPRSRSETVLCEIWREVFNLDAVGTNDDFFDLGGDSLNAAVISARLHALMNVEIDLRSFIAHPTLKELAGVVDRLLLKPLVTLPQLRPALPRYKARLSFFQERIWTFSRTLQGAAGYTVAKRYVMRGLLDTQALQDCLTYIVGRHDILRAIYIELDGELVQSIGEHFPVEMPLVDLQHADDARERAERFCRQLANSIFDLTSPSIRFVLVRTKETEHQLLCISHHILSDGWSWKLFIDELAVLYTAKIERRPLPLPAHAALQYSDFSHWQRAVIGSRGQFYEDAVASCRRRLEGCAELLLPFKRRSAAPVARYTEGVQLYRLDALSSERLAEVAQCNQVTFFVLRAAAFALLLRDATGQTDQPIGSYFSHRSTLSHQQIFGFFADTAILRLSCADLTQLFPSWLQSMRDVIVETLAGPRLPHDLIHDVLRQRGIAVPEIKAILSVATQWETRHFGGLTLDAIESHFETMPWGFHLLFDESDGQHQLYARFDANIYDPRSVTDFTSRYLDLLKAIAVSPDRTLAELLELARSR